MINWQETTVAADETHHLFLNKPTYPNRFIKVLKYHAPGLAPVIDESGAYHIDTRGIALYTYRYLNSFGYYQNRAAVASPEGWFHIDISGNPVYSERYSWCGNFQDYACTVKNKANQYFHIDLQGCRLYPEKYCYVGDFRENYAVVCNDRGLHTHIDQQGNLLHGHWFLGLNVFHKGYACAKDNIGWFHINKQGKELYKERYQSLECFYNNIAHAERQDGTLLTIDQNGKVVSIIAEKLNNESTLHALSTDLVSYWKTQTIYAAVQLKVLDFLPAETAFIAQKVSIKEEFCQRLLRALQEIGIVLRLDSKWILSAKGQMLTPSDLSPMAAATAIWADSHYREWSELTNCLKENKDNSDYFLKMATATQDLKKYQHALSIYAKNDYQSFIKNIDWLQHHIVIDVGGGTGTLIHALLNHALHLNGIVIDLPQVIGLIESTQRHSRANYIGNDIFAPWNFSADAIILARVLHDWDDEKAFALLSNSKKHLLQGGKIYILEMILSDNKADGALLDLNMLVMTGGKERTLDVWHKLVQNAGLKITNIQECSSVINILTLEPST